MSDKNTQPAAPRAAAHGSPDIKLLELLVCPVTKTSLIYNKQTSELVSRQARLAFPIRSGVAILVPAEARELGPDELPGAATRG